MPLTVVDLTFGYPGRPLLDGLNWTFSEGRISGVVGPSGVGKSTLLSLLVGLEVPHGGRINAPAEMMRDGAVALDQVAWMSQRANLFLRRTTLDNVVTPLIGRGVARGEAVERARWALRQVGMEEFASRRAATLSGGERQRVAMARTIAVGARLLIADEPTSSLDRANRVLLLDGLRAVADTGAIVIVATHDPEVISGCDDVLDLTKVTADHGAES